MRSYTVEEKTQLLANLDLEVEHRLKRFRAWAADVVEGYKIRQDGQLARIPKVVRGLRMSVFADQYGGDLNAAFVGLSSDRIRAAQELAIEHSPRKRKFDVVAEAAAGEQNARTNKNFRTIPFGTPKRKPGPSSVAATPTTMTRQRTTAMSMHTPGGASAIPVRRVTSLQPPSPSPRKLSGPSRPAVNHRPASPTKPLWGAGGGAGTQTPQRPRVPSSSVFAPTLPTNHPRMPRKDENLLSLNGSPVANPLASPYERGTRLPSGPLGTSGTGRPPSRTSSQSALFTNQQQTRGLGRQLAHANTFSARLDTVEESHEALRGSGPTPSLGSASTLTDGSRPVTPATPPQVAVGGALITIPLKSGQTLSFDPLSLREADSAEAFGLELAGLSEFEKQKAREEVGEVVGKLRKVVERWKI